MRIRLKYVYRQRRADGKISYRFERPGFAKTWLKSTPHTPEMLAEWSMLMQGVVADHAPRHVAQGSLSWLVNQYRASAAWAELAPATKSQYSAFYTQITDQAPDVPFALLTTTDLRRWRDNRAATPGAANNFLKAFAALYAWAIELDHVTENPAKDVEPDTGVGSDIESIREELKRRQENPQ
ncbi:MAG: hypothetical protein IIC61_10480 [Proteobacteria bacterium]|nr:hypothetical protein [Pseudomonadota bacterium]